MGGGGGVIIEVSPALAPPLCRLRQANGPPASRSASVNQVGFIHCIIAIFHLSDRAIAGGGPS